MVKQENAARSDQTRAAPRPAARASKGARGRLIGVTLALLAALAACSSTPARVRLLLGTVVAPRANQNSPVAVSFVVVNDQKLFEKLLQMSAKQWFDQREQLRRDDPAGATFTEWQWEFVPGQAPPPAVIEVNGAAAGAVIFANYKTAGEHRFRVGPQRAMRIELGDEDLSVSPLELPSE